MDIMDLLSKVKSMSALRVCVCVCCKGCVDIRTTVRLSSTFLKPYGLITDWLTKGE